MDKSYERISIKHMTLIAMFASLTAILSQISIPLPFTPVPINLAMLSVFISGGVLGGKKGAISQLIYVALGAVGVPVFAQFTAGISRLFGPTGGYILGYVLSAFLIGFLFEKFKRSIINISIVLIIGLLTCYAVGTAWFMFVTKNSFYTSMAYCIIPFIPGDILKITASAFFLKKLNKFKII